MLDTTSRTSEDECKWCSPPNDFFPETNNTIKCDSCYGYKCNCYTMHNNTHSVHKRLLVMWRARLLCFEPSRYVYPPPLSEANCPPFPPSWWAGPPGSQDGFLFPRIHTYPLHTVRYSIISRIGYEFVYSRLVLALCRSRELLISLYGNLSVLLLLQVDSYSNDQKFFGAVWQVPLKPIWHWLPCCGCSSPDCGGGGGGGELSQLQLLVPLVPFLTIPLPLSPTHKMFMLYIAKIGDLEWLDLDVTFCNCLFCIYYS